MDNYLTEEELQILSVLVSERIADLAADREFPMGIDRDKYLTLKMLSAKLEGITHIQHWLKYPR